jgi:hypothetical protein
MTDSRMDATIMRRHPSLPPSGRISKFPILTDGPPRQGSTFSSGEGKPPASHSSEDS